MSPNQENESPVVSADTNVPVVNSAQQPNVENIGNGLNTTIAPQAQPITTLQQNESPTQGSGGATPSPTSFAGQPKKNTKKPILIGGIVFAFMLALAAFYFLFYAPNTSNNVWKTGLTRSGTALNKVTETAFEKKSLDKVLSSQVEASIEGDVAGTKFNGSLDTTFNETDSDNKLKFTSTIDNKNVDIGLNVLSSITNKSKLPNIYFQFYGISALGLDNFAPGLTEYENKWIAIDSDYIAKYVPAEIVPEINQQNVTAEDTAAVVQTVNDVNSQYIFTNDPTKAVLVQKKFIAKEEVEGIKAYHYEVGINATNARSYCKEMVTKVAQLNVAKKMVGDDKTLEELKNQTQKSCDEIKESKETFDLWIDAKYKLIYKVRIADNNDKKSYLDIGQRYKGGDDINFFIRFNDNQSKSTVNLNLSTNIKSNESQGDITAASTSESSPYNVKVSIKVKPFDGSINTEKPAGSISIEEMLNKLGLDPSSLTGGAQPVVEDSANTTQ